ncbi:MAG: serine/threonine protein kinase [Myxococcales bacterium]|nr:serine/threonine protein kinase [Myxococcales bacterium]
MLHRFPDDTPGAADSLAPTLSADGSVGPPEESHPTAGPRYAQRALLGRGGMGDVTACHDRVFGREVARKALRRELEADPLARQRFVREARVQGKLEHPGIVPVYDLAEGPDGVPYFVMKRIRGMTLDEILVGHANGDERVRASFGLRKLLAAFCSVCMAVDFAHARGIVHRDIKPPNIMLGDFGEVYLLDWGVAAAHAETGGESAESRAQATDGGGDTALGEDDSPGARIAGTPGFVPPEHLRGETPGTPRGDVYALGAVLFELLAHEPLVPRGPLLDMVRTTLAGVDADPARRAPGRDVAPELAAICLRATALAPESRYPSARALCADVERYLEGDRDLERRRVAGAAHAERAEAALAAALAGTVAFEQGRAQAMQELNRALALDPSNRGPLRTLVRVLTESPREIPEEVRARARAEDGRTLQMGARLSAVTPLLYLLMLPIVYALGVRSAWLVGAAVVAIAGAALAGYLVSSRASATLRGRGEWAIVVLRAGILFALSRMFGPLVLVPTLAAAFGVAMQVHPERAGRHVGAWVACLSVGVPTLLEWAGVLPASYAFGDGRMSIVPQMHELPALPTEVLLLVASIATIATACVFVGRIRRALSEAQLRLQLNAWHLARLLPDDEATR